jgi:threonine/homoserine/homoserine lactone efflux protein
MNFLEVKEAIIIGIILAFLIGPVFFMLIEISILKGFRAAMSFDLGVMIGDVFFLLIAYFGSKPLISNIENNPLFFKIGGSLLVLYGLYTFFKTKQVDEIQDDTIVIKEDSKYLRLFLKGFFINLINFGTLGFWIGLMLVYGSKYSMTPKKIFYFFGIIILSYLTFDALKIVTAKKLRSSMTPGRIFKFKKLIGLILLGFGIILFVKAYIPEEKMQQIEKTVEKPFEKFKKNGS